MKFTVDKQFYSKMNFFSRTFMFIGFIFFDLAMKASGMTTNEDKKD